MKYQIFTLSICLLIFTSGYSQEVVDEQESNNSFTVSTEIFSPALGGFIGEVGYNFGKNRIQGTISFVSEVPVFYNPQSDIFSPSRNYFDLAYTRFIKEDQRGFHYGVDVGYIFDETVTEIDTDLEGTKDYWRIGARLGYFWYPFFQKDNALKGLYLEPAIQIGLALGEQDVVFPTGNTFEASPLKISGPLFHLGYKF